MINKSVYRNEPLAHYAPGSAERISIQKKITELKSTEMIIPMIINGKEVFTDTQLRIAPPHEHAHTLGYFCEGKSIHVSEAISAALHAKHNWASKSLKERAAIFLKAADLISTTYRSEINAATMLGQSKNVYQAEIDSACELIDFFRLNVKFAHEIEAIQPHSPEGVHNQMVYRPLEGFVFALTPFNFTAIAGNLPSAPALMGNTVVWKPAYTQIYSARIIMKVLMEAGLPNGVINLIYTDGPTTGDIIFQHRYFAGLHFTGSTAVFKHISKTIYQNIDLYQNFPRIVGETGGKDFVLAHADCDIQALSVALVRGAFEYQGQKCSAASRAYIPKSIWPEVEQRIVAMLQEIKTGSVEDFSNFVNAVIDEKAFDKITSYIDAAKADSDATILAGGSYNKSIGYFIDPTIIVTKNPSYKTMKEEIFGPVLTIYIYEDKEWNQVLQLVDTTTSYALTGSIFAKSAAVIEEVKKALYYSAGNFYINDKPTGAVVDQQPFGGARLSGTNDKAGSILNLLRWVSPQVIKENFTPPHDYRYDFMK
ncbi:L-glutamate gamma-semialdehyde dehydrogenase [Cytophaga aurantiaca]|uniref:L-glutamate gamma-semialdehyde dehydrogenase n=1 Tax=Cytophaga aurantiaca TaxID=29530 RepID=UPI000382EB0E|nr:L-glutamate gamma-semialdehyde dehydrogenase [Cytophaga aurantiaca]